MNLFMELHGMVAMLSSMTSSAIAAPAVFSFTVSSTRHIGTSHIAAVSAVLAGFVDMVASLANTAFKNNALITVASANASPLHTVSMRSVNTFISSNDSSYFPTRSDPDYSPFCAVRNWNGNFGN